MATGTIIQIKRTANIAAPTVSDLAEAELAYSQDASSDGAGAILYIESVNANASPSIHKVGGKYYTDIVDGATANNTAGNLVKRDGSGNFSANTVTANTFTGNISGSAASATIANTANALTTARTITLGGDLTGNVSFNGSSDVTLTATIAADSIALGTDTTGNYVGNVAAGTGLILVGDTYTVTNSGASAYTINGSSNPTLTLYRGFTYTFNVSASGHPFWIKTSQTTGTGNAYSTGVTNNGIDVGTITFVVPSDAPATLYYICQFHSSMVGTINVLTASENANVTLGLGTSGVTAGTFGNATSIPAITVDQYGRVTSVSNTAISFNASNLGTPNYVNLTNGVGLPVSTGISGLGAFQTTLLAGNAYTTVNAGTYGNASYTPIITVDVYGRVSNVYTVATAGNSGNTSSGTIGSFTRSGNTFTINESGVDFSASIAGSDIPVGVATQGNLISNAVTLTTGSTLSNSIAQLNQVLGRLVPASPPAFPSGSNTLTMSSATTSSKMCTGFAQFFNTSANTTVAAGTTIAARRAAAYLTSTIPDSGPGDSGTVTLFLNDVSAGSRALATGSDNGTYGANLVIGDNVDYGTKTGAAQGFWESFDANGSGVAKPGWNSVYITHSGAGTTNTLTWYYDDSNPAAPSFANKTLTESSNTRIFSSTVPHYTSATSFTLAAYVNSLSGNTYPTTDTFVTGTAGGAFQAPSSITYSTAGVSTPLTQNLYVASGNVAISTTSSITTGFGSSSSGPSLTSTNGYNSSGASAFTVSGTPTILYKTGTASSMEETTLTFGSAVGTGSGLAARIVNPGTTDNPAYSANATTFNSESGTLTANCATIVGAVLKHDQTNYSTGYLPVGPDLSSGRTGAQYYTFRFVRTSVSKFNIKFTGTIAGLWVALPGSTIDTSSTINGWVDMSIAYAGAGVPGAGAGGNGSNGCALGGVVTLNSAVTAHSKTCTFGTVSSSDTATNEIYVRIKLTSGQTVTALSLETASN